MGNKAQLQRGLQNRHIQLIAIGGCIGTGLFLGAGKIIALAGPSIILTYLIIGFFLFFVMRAMGELLLSNLKYKSFVDFIADILGPRAGFFVGWSYWFCWVIIGIADIVAITSYMQLWWPNIPLWMPGAITIFLLGLFNLLSVKLFGEIEFWLSIIKIGTILLLIVVGIYLVLTGFVSPNGFKASLSNLWSYGGIMPNGFKGFFASFQLAIFAFLGIELVGTASAETANPKESLPSAINKIPVRIMVFYVFALIAIMAVTPWSGISPTKSPFVDMFGSIGITSAAYIINAVVLSSALSSANSGMYSTGRMLYGLSKIKSAPQWFSKLTKAAVPANAIVFSCSLLIFSIALLYLSKGSEVAGETNYIMYAFTVVSTISSLCFLFVWIMMILSYMKYRRVSPELHEASIYKMPFGIPMCWAILAFFLFIGVLCAFEKDTRMGLYVTPFWFIILGIAYAFKRRSETSDAHQSVPDMLFANR